MRISLITAVVVGAVMTAATSGGHAQAKPRNNDVDVGAFEYKSSCATCHGVSGKGDGPMSARLKERPTDLTRLARDNGGVFPAQHLYEVIDGRKEIAAHGSREMPVWGAHYLEEASFQYRYTEAMGPVAYEALVRARIMALVDYLNRLQVK
jgi:mono/diheme cytochrome c family protein